VQIIIQLGRFNKQVLRMIADREDERANMVAAAAAMEKRSGGSSSKVTCSSGAVQPVLACHSE